MRLKKEHNYCSSDVGEKQKLQSVKVSCDVMDCLAVGKLNFSTQKRETFYPSISNDGDCENTRMNGEGVVAQN